MKVAHLQNPCHASPRPDERTKRRKDERSSPGLLRRRGATCCPGVLSSCRRRAGTGGGPPRTAADRRHRPNRRSRAPFAMHNAECTMHNGGGRGRVRATGNAQCRMHNAQWVMARAGAGEGQCTMQNAECTMQNAQWERVRSSAGRARATQPPVPAQTCERYTGRTGSESRKSGTRTWRMPAKSSGWTVSSVRRSFGKSSPVSRRGESSRSSVSGSSAVVATWT